jgi:hypothetical protein
MGAKVYLEKPQRNDESPVFVNRDGKSEFMDRGSKRSFKNKKIKVESNEVKLCQDFINLRSKIATRVKDYGRNMHREGIIPSFLRKNRNN